MKTYRISLGEIRVEAENIEDAKQQALSMIEEGAWELYIAESWDHSSENLVPTCKGTGIDPNDSGYYCPKCFKGEPYYGDY